MAKVSSTAGSLTAGIESDLRVRFRAMSEKILKEETDAAKRRIDQRMSEEIAKLVMTVSNWYTVQEMENRIVIEVKKNI